MEEENIYKLLFDNSSEGFIITSDKAIIEKVNARSLELFGYDSADELIGQPIEVLIPREYHKKHVHNRDEYAKNPTKRQMGKAMTLYGLKKDEDKFPVEVGLNHYTLNGEKKILALISDITDRKKQEDYIAQLNKDLEKKVEKRTKELHQSQLLYQQIARNFPNGTINVFDEDLKYVFVEGTELFKRGITSSQLIGKNYLNLLPKEVKSKMQQELPDVFKGSTKQFNIQIKDQYFQINAVPLFNEGKIDQILVVEKDITREKTAEINLETALQHEKELNELKSRFVSMASHEFRTPLSTINSSASLLGKYTLTEQQEKRDKHVDRIKNAVSNMVDILNDFLSLSKLEEGIIEANIETFDLRNLFNEICDEMKDNVDKGQTLHSNLTTSLEISTDQKILRNVLYNLISNALKYSFPETEITCTVENKDDSIKINITNYGIGIPKAEQKNLFKRFFRAGNATNIEGTGLGLNIVEKYVKLLNGIITFESIENETTTFTVVLPK